MATPAIGCMLFMAGLESSGIHVPVTVFPCEIWVMGRTWLSQLLQTRQGCSGGGGGGIWLPLAAVRLHDLPWEELMGWTAQQDNKMPWSPWPCPRCQRLVQECAPYGPLLSFGTKLQVLWPWGPQWHSVLQSTSTALQHLLTQSPRGSSLGPTCLALVTAIALPRNKTETNASSVPSLWAMASSHTAAGFLLRWIHFRRVNSISGALQGSWSKS